MDSAGPYPIGVYTQRLHMTILERVACRPVCTLLMEADRMPGTSRMMRWWDQDVVNEPEE